MSNRLSLNSLTNHTASTRTTASSTGRSSNGTPVKAGSSQPRRGLRADISELAGKILAGFKKLTQRSIQQTAPEPARAKGAVARDELKRLKDRADAVISNLTLINMGGTLKNPSKSGQRLAQEVKGWLPELASSTQRGAVVKSLSHSELNTLAAGLEQAAMDTKDIDQRRILNRFSYQLNCLTKNPKDAASAILKKQRSEIEELIKEKHPNKPGYFRWLTNSATPLKFEKNFLENLGFESKSTGNKKNISRDMSELELILGDSDKTSGDKCVALVRKLDKMAVDFDTKTQNEKQKYLNEFSQGDIYQLTSIMIHIVKDAKVDLPPFSWNQYRDLLVAAHNCIYTGAPE